MFLPFSMRHAAQPCQWFFRPWIELGIELAVQEAVRGLLADEAAHRVRPVGLLRGREQRDSLLHRVDEELLADRETHRERVHVVRAEGGASAPQARKALGQIDLQVADRQAARGFEGRRQVGGCVHGAPRSGLWPRA